MTKEDYTKYYIQGSDHYLIPGDIFDELMYEFDNWRNQSYEYENKIKEVRKHIEVLKEFDEANFGEGAYSKDWEELLEELGDNNE